MQSVSTITSVCSEPYSSWPRIHIQRQVKTARQPAREYCKGNAFALPREQGWAPVACVESAGTSVGPKLPIAGKRRTLRGPPSAVTSDKCLFSPRGRSS
jgi:hypothetical protein